MRTRLLALAACLALTGCDNKPATTASDMGDLGAPADLTPPPVCADPPELQPDGGVCVGGVSGRVVDEKGGAVGSLVVSVGAGTCFYGKTAADGSFTVGVGAHIVFDRFATLLHGAPDHASYYAHLPKLVDTSATFAAPLVLPTLPTSGPVVATDGSAQTLTAGDLTLDIAAGTDVSIAIEDLTAGPIGSQFRPLKVANPGALPFVDPASPPDALYAFSPFEVRFSQKARVTFANSAGLPAGAAVDVQGMGGLLGSLPPAGNFTSVAVAHVSSDGKTITMDPGEGVTSLTWLALRKQ